MADVPDTDGRMWKVVLEKRYPVELANILHLTTEYVSSSNGYPVGSRPSESTFLIG